MLSRRISALATSLVIGLFIAACGGGSNKSDAGTDDGGGLSPCFTDADCDDPETCDDDGYCRWDPNPDPDDNTLVGAFDCGMNNAYGAGEVNGKFDGHYIYMQYPGAKAEYDQDEDALTAVIYLDGVVTNELMLRIRMKVPYDSPTDTAIKFGVGGVAVGTFYHMELNADGYIVGESPVAEVIGGQIAFSEFGNGTGNIVDGTFRAELKKVNPPGQ